jgi:hypothetical protein
MGDGHNGNHANNERSVADDVGWEGQQGLEPLNGVENSSRVKISFRRVTLETLWRRLWATI